MKKFWSPFPIKPTDSDPVLLAKAAANLGIWFGIAVLAMMLGMMALVAMFN